MNAYDKIYINGQWVASDGKKTISVFDSTNEEIDFDASTRACFMVSSIVIGFMLTNLGSGFDTTGHAGFGKAAAAACTAAIAASVLESIAAHEAREIIRVADWIFIGR